MKKFKKQSIFFAFVLPALLIYFVLFLYPLFQSIYFSLFNWNGLNRESWSGLTNFIAIFHQASFYLALKNNIVFSMFVLVIQTVISLLLALLLYRDRKGGTSFKTIFFLPVILSTVSIGFTWSYIYDPNVGPLNMILHLLRISSPPNWLGTPGLALLAIAWVLIWQYSGYSMIIFIAGLQAIPEELYEVAKIEGSNKWQIFSKVTLPMLTPTMALVVILTTIGSFKVFELIYVMTSGGPFSSTKVLAYQIYDEAFKYNSIGYAAAISVILLILVGIIATFQVFFFRRQEETLSGGG